MRINLFLVFFFFSFRMLKVPKNDAKKGTIMRKRMLNVKTPVSPHSTSSSLWILVLNTPKVTKKNIIIINSWSFSHFPFFVWILLLFSHNNAKKIVFCLRLFWHKMHFIIHCLVLGALQCSKTPLLLSKLLLKLPITWANKKWSVFSLKNA